MRVLVACEYSGRVRDAFLALGHDAWSCDLLESESTDTDDKASRHLVGDVVQFLGDEWDLMIAHPPCTYLSVAGARWNYANPERLKKQHDAIGFVQTLMDAPIPRIAIENPISVISTIIRKPDQIIQPWQFGHGETKATCLWLKNLPKLVPTDIVEGREAKVHRMPPGPNRWKDRSRTYLGIAKAMAEQWGEPMSYAPDPFYGDYDPPLPTCGVCGDEFEPWPDSYCGREFMETEVCRHCAEDDGGSDPLGGWDEDVLRDR